MRSVFITLTFLVAFFLTGCGNQQSTASTEKEVDPQATENEFITAAVEFSRDAESSSKDLEELLKNLENVEDSAWKIDVNDALTDLTMERNDYVTFEYFLSDEQMNKYDSTLKHYATASSLIREIYDEGFNALQTYDKKTLEEISIKLPELNDALLKGKEQLEVERYE